MPGGGDRRQKEGEGLTYNLQLAWVGVGSSSVGTFSYCKGMLACGRKARAKVTQLPFGADRHQPHGGDTRVAPHVLPLGLTGAPLASLRVPRRLGELASRRPRRLHLQGSPWERGPPPSARPPPLPAPPFSHLSPAPPGPSSLRSRSRCQSLEKWNLVSAAPCAGLAERH